MAGNIKGITIEFNGNTTKLSKALRDIEKEAHNTQSKMNQINTALKFNPGSVDLWRQKQDALKQKIEQTEKKLQLLKQQQAQMDAAGVDKNSEEYQKLQREIITTESKLKSFKAQLAAIGNVNLRALGEQFKAIGDKMITMGSNLTQKVTMPLAAVGAVGAKKFAEVDKTMQLTNSTMGNTAEQAEMLNQKMKDAASQSVYSMDDAATATLNFARAGLDAEQAAAALAPAMNLAAGEGGNLDTVSAGLVATIQGFGGSFDDASEYANVFANACNNSALDIDSLSSSMSIAAPIFAAAGYTVNDAALYMGVMANKGIDANVAANALKTGMARLVEPSKQGAEWMDELGISITNADGSMKDSVTVQKELHDAFAGLSESEQIAAASAIFGKNQMSNWLALINTAPDSVSELNGQLNDMNTVERMASAMMSGFGGTLEQLKSTADVAATSFGEALAPALKVIASALQKALEWFNNLSPGMRSVIATIALVAAAIGPLMVVGGTLMKGIGTLLTTIGRIVPIISGVISGIGTLASAGLLPFIAIAAAIVAAVILIIKYWDQIKAFALTVAEAIKQAWNDAKESLSNTLNAIATTFSTIWNSIKTAITTVINAIKTVITTVFNAIKTFIGNVVTGYLIMVRTQFMAIKTVTTTVWNAIKTAIQVPINAAKAAVTTAINAIKSVINGIVGVVGTVKSAFNNIKNAMISPISSAFDKVKSIINKIKGIFPLSIGKIFSNFKLPHISVSGGSAPFGIGGKGSLPKFSVNWYAKGGVFDEPSIIGVGEGKGKEIVTPEKLLDERLALSNANIETLLTQMVRQNQIMIEELQKDKDIKIDKRVAGRLVNELVTV